MVQSAGEYGVPSSARPLEVAHNGGDDCRDTLQGGRPLVARLRIKVLGVSVDSRVFTMVAVRVREQAASGGT